MKPSEDATSIGRSVTLRGDISGSEDLFLDGVLEGTLTLPENRLTIGPNARVTAELKVKDLLVFGVLDGNVHASGRVELRQSAQVNGNVFASRLSIEESATIKGRVELAGRAQAAGASETSASAAAGAVA